MDSWHFLRHYAKLRHAYMYDLLGIVIPLAFSPTLKRAHICLRPANYTQLCMQHHVTSSTNDTWQCVHSLISLTAIFVTTVQSWTLWDRAVSVKQIRAAIHSFMRVILTSRSPQCTWQVAVKMRRWTLLEKWVRLLCYVTMETHYRHIRLWPHSQHAGSQWWLTNDG